MEQLANKTIGKGYYGWLAGLPGSNMHSERFRVRFRNIAYDMKRVSMSD